MSSPRSHHEVDENRASIRQSDYHHRVRSAGKGHTQSFVLIHQGDDLVAADLTRPMPRPGAQPECEYSGIRPRHRTHYSSDPQRPYELFDPSQCDNSYSSRPEKVVRSPQPFQLREKRPSTETRGRDSRRRRCGQGPDHPLPRLLRRETIIHQQHIPDLVIDPNRVARKTSLRKWESEDSSFEIADDSSSEPPSAPSLRCLRTPELSPIRGAYFPDLDGTAFLASEAMKPQIDDSYDDVLR